MLSNGLIFIWTYKKWVLSFTVIYQRILEFIDFIILDRLLIEKRTLTTLQITWLDGFPHYNNQVFTLELSNSSLNIVSVEWDTDLTEWTH